LAIQLSNFNPTKVAYLP